MCDVYPAVATESTVIPVTKSSDLGRGNPKQRERSNRITGRQLKTQEAVRIAGRRKNK